MTVTFEVLGFIGSMILASAFVPQHVKVYQTKSASDLSYPFVLLYITGVACLLTYGLGESLWPIFVPAAFELLGGVVLLALKITYDRRDAAAAAATEKTPTDGFVAALTPV